MGSPMVRAGWIAALAIVTGSIGTALAEPCAVNIVRAPDEVRPVVERWLAQESRCKPLEVRIVATEDGLYILARDDRGRLHERVVPSPDAAGVLIASWAADDLIGSEPVVAPAPTSPTPIDAMPMPPGEAP